MPEQAAGASYGDSMVISLSGIDHRNGPNDQGVGWNVLMSLQRVAIGFGMAALGLGPLHALTMGCLASLMLTMAAAKRVDHAWKLVRRAEHGEPVRDVVRLERTAEKRLQPAAAHVHRKLPRNRMSPSYM